MFKYNKSLIELFQEKPKNLAHLIKQLEEAIALHEEIMAKKAEDEDKMTELASLATSGTGVKAMKARAELEQMRARSNTGQNVAEIRAAFKKRKAKKELDAGDPMAEEMKQLAIRKKAEEEAEAKRKAESRERLKAKAAFLNAS